MFSSCLVEMVGELFLPHDMPEPPKQSFFQGLFGGGTRNLDREELCELSLSSQNTYLISIELIDCKQFKHH